MLDQLAGLTPFHLLAQHQHHMLLWYCSLPITNPIHRLASLSRNRQKLHSHNSPLHLLFHMYSLNPIETVPPTCHPTSWFPPFSTSITKNKDKAIALDAADNTDIVIYTDGSGYKDSIGASAIFYRQGQEITQLRHLLGLDTCFVVFNAECTGLLLSTHLL
ncbi:hypothetical protein BDQ17DRAFT_1470821, partial [Cyathus striatus]